MITATLACPDGCFSVTYQTDHDDQMILKEDAHRDGYVDARTFINELGSPTRITRNGGDCPNCGISLDVDWGDDDE